MKETSICLYIFGEMSLFTRSVCIHDQQHRIKMNTLQFVQFVMDYSWIIR